MGIPDFQKLDKQEDTPASASNIYDTNKSVLYTNILSKRYI